MKKTSFKKRFQDLLYHAVIFCVVITASFVTLEFFSRLGKVAGLLLSKTYTVKLQEMRAYDELLGWKNKPNIKYCSSYKGKEITIHINSMGFRGAREYALKDSGRHRRIIALGDSMTFGGEQVEDDQTWPYYLEQILQSTADTVEVINMSCVAYGLDQEYLWFQRDGLLLKPCLLLIGLSDLSFSRATLSRWIQGENKPKFRRRGSRLELTNVPVPPAEKAAASRITTKDVIDTLFHWEGSFVWSFIKNRLYKLNNAFGASLPEMSESYRLGKALLVDIQKVCEENNIRMVIFFFPKIEWRNEAPPIYHSILKLRQALGIEMVDCTELFRKSGNWNGLFMDDGHFSPDANRIIAQEAARVIEEQDLLAE